MIQEHERVVLLQDLPDLDLRSGDVRIVVMVHDAGAGYEVEFMALDGETIGVTTLTPDQLRKVQPREIATARAL